MSCFLVDKTHIDALLTAGLPRRGHVLHWDVPGTNPPEFAELTEDTAGRVGAMLLAQNMRSVNHRYDEDEWEPAYEFTRLPGTPNPLTVFMAISGLEYQACETDDWYQTEAFAFLYALRKFVTEFLPGFSDAPGWHISDEQRDVFLTVRRKA